MINFYTGFIKCDGSNETVTVDHVIGMNLRPFIMKF